MRAFLLLALSALLSFTFAQDLSPPLAPTLTSVVPSSDARYALISWSKNYNCGSGDFCWYSLYRDDNVFIDVYVENGASDYSYPAYFGTGAGELQYGVHTFWVIETNLMGGNSPASNSITINLSPPVVTTPAPTPNPSAIVGDPQFTGLRGQVYQVHGAPNEIFNIISDKDLQYNSKFVYLESGDCPALVTGESVDTPCFTHPGTYLGELGLETSAGDKIFIKAGPASKGFAKIELNGVKVEQGELVNLQSLENGQQPFLYLNNSHQLLIEAGNFRLEFSNSDWFVNQIVTMLDSSVKTSHGLLGQSWSTKVHNAAATIPWIEGSVWDYAIEDHKLFSHKFAFNKFSHGNNVHDDDDEDEEEKIELEKQRAAASLRAKQMVEKIKLMGKRKIAHTKHAHKHEADI